MRPLFDRALEDGPGIEAATIPVELGRGPLLLVSGEADAMWPSTPMGEIAVRRARGARTAAHLHFPGAGHTVGGPPGVPSATQGLHPVDGWTYDFGGSHAANAAARVASWPVVVAFLQGTALETGEWQPNSPVGIGSSPSSGS